MALQILELVGLRPLRAIEVGVVHGDGSVNQQTLADLAGVGINTLVAIERGEGNPQLTTLLTILETLGLQMDIHVKTMTYETV